MKRSLIVLFMLMAFGLQAQELNKVITDPDIHREILFGWVNREGISSKDYLVNEQQKYDAYTPDLETINTLRKVFHRGKKFSVLVVFATWCGDSKAHVPEFFKVADEAGITQVKYLAVNRRKTAGDVDMSTMNIERVPTFIVYKKGVEIGRVIERPTVSLEKDLLQIVSKK